MILLYMILILIVHTNSWSVLTCYEFNMRVDRRSSQKAIFPRKLSKQIICEWCEIDTLWILMFILDRYICFNPLSANPKGLRYYDWHLLSASKE